MRLPRILALAIFAVLATAAPGLAAGVPADTSPPGPAISASEGAAVDAARAKVAAGDTRGAIEGLAPYVSAHPADLTAGRLLGDLYFRVPDYAKAEKAYKNVLAAAPGDRDTHNRLGSLYAVLDRTDEAIAEFQKSLPSRGGFAGLVLAHKHQGDLATWIARERQFVEDHPFDVVALRNVAQYERALRNTDRSISLSERLVGLRPGSCDARVDLANAYVDVGRIDPAIVHLKRCIDLDANFYPAVVNLGEAYLEKEQGDLARPYLDRALALRPDGSEALIDLGYLLDTKGDWKSAVSYYQRAIDADPLRPEAYIDLGYDYNEHKLFPLAEAAFLKGLSVAQDDGRLHYMLAVTYNLQGKITLARSQYQLALASDEPIVQRAARAELVLLPEGDRR